MLTNGVLSVFDSIRQTHTVLLKKYTLLASMHIYGPTSNVEGTAPASDELMLQSLLAVYDHSTNAHAQRIVFFAEAVAYQLHLSDEEIFLAARIIAVVDSYDAMTYHRAYHEPQSVAEACAELQRCAGSQYDPHVVAAFLSLLEELPERHEQRSKRNPATNGTGSAGVVFAMPSLQFDGCVPVSA